VPLALGIVTLFAIGSVGTGSGDEPGPIGPIGLVSGAVGATPPGNAADGTTSSAADTPILSAPDARLALPGGAPPVSGLSGYRWPLPMGRLTQDYGPTTFASRVVNGEPFHDGIDLATFCGDRIVAAHDGVVLAASRHFDDVIGWVGSLESEPAGDDAVAGKAGEFDIHGARVDRRSLANHGPNVRRRPGPGANKCGRTQQSQRQGRGVRCGPGTPSVVVPGTGRISTLTRGA